MVIGTGDLLRTEFSCGFTLEALATTPPNTHTQPPWAMLLAGTLKELFVRDLGAESPGPAFQGAGSQDNTSICLEQRKSLQEASWLAPDGSLSGMQ